jgi:RNA polymerase sigma-70 factor (ECF subfamily)
MAQARDRDAPDPQTEAVLGDSVSLALLVVLETLTPAERVAFVLHDLFAVPFDDIAPIVGRSSDATRQLASRARRRVQGATPTGQADALRHREIVTAFLTAARGGDFDALVALLDPDVVLSADAAAVATGADPEVLGAARVAETFAGRARAARPAIVDGAPALVWAMHGDPKVVFAITIGDDHIVAIRLVADPAAIAAADIALLDD